MTEPERFRGSFVAIVTPMTAEGGIDWRAWARLLDFHLTAATRGVVIAGTTGESAALTESEIMELTHRALEQVAGRMQIIVGAGTGATASTVERARKFSSLGADALMLVTPFYNKPPQEGMYRHFMSAADAASVPVILYNVPSRTAVDLLPATVARLSAHPSIVALKDATASMTRLRELRAACPGEFALLSGDDATAIEWLGAGAAGVISVTANIAPGAMAEAVGASLQGDAARARAIDATLQELHCALFIETSPMPVKWGLAQLGLIANHLRLPLVEMSAAHGEALLRAMRSAGLTLSGRAA